MMTTSTWQINQMENNEAHKEYKNKNIELILNEQ